MTVRLDSILIISFVEKIGEGGGDIQMRNLKTFWQMNGILVNTSNIISVNSFTFLQIFKATLKSLTMKLNNLNEIEKYDIILAKSPYPPDLIMVYRLSKRYKKPRAVYFYHISPGLLFHPFRRGIFRVILNELYSIAALSIIRRTSIPIFLDNPKTNKNPNVITYPLPLALEKMAILKQSLSLVQKEFDMCYIGRIEKKKGVEDILQVTHILKEKFKVNTRTILVGKGKSRYVKKIKKMIVKYGLSKNIVVKGYVSESEKFEILRNSKIFIFLSYEEGWSLSVMEAASIGIPILAYELPAYYYLRENYFGVKPSSILECAEMIVRIMNNYEKAKETGEIAKKIVDKFSYKFISNQQLSFFGKIITDYYGSN